jgi:hypothetical protein
MWIKIVVTFSGGGITYGGISLESEFLNTGDQGFVLDGNALPISWTGISKLFL